MSRTSLDLSQDKQLLGCPSQLAPKDSRSTPLALTMLCIPLAGWGMAQVEGEQPPGVQVQAVMADHPGSLRSLYVREP